MHLLVRPFHGLMPDLVFHRQQSRPVLPFQDALQLLPESLNRVEFRTIGRQLDQDQIVRNDQTLGPVNRRTIDHHEMESRRVGQAKCRQKGLKILSAHPLELHEKGVSRIGLHAAVEVKTLSSGVFDADGLVTFGSENAAGLGHPAKSAFVLEVEVDGLVPRLAGDGRFDFGSKVLFLNASTASGACL